MRFMKQLLCANFHAGSFTYIISSYQAPSKIDIIFIIS